MVWARLLLLVALQGYDVSAEPVSICTNVFDASDDKWFNCFGKLQNLTKVTSVPTFQTICDGYDARARQQLDVQFFDWNNDDAADLILRSGDGPFRYFENDGSGGLVEKTGFDNPFDGIQPPGLPATSAGSPSPGFAVARWDGDVHDDILIGGAGSTVYLWLGAWGGTLHESTSVLQLQLGNPNATEHGRRFQAVDWDNDKDLDLIVTEVFLDDQSVNAASVARYFERTSPTALQEMTGEDSPFTTVPLGVRSYLTAGNWDGDKDNDLVLVSDDEEVVYYNRNQAGRLERHAGELSPFNLLGPVSSENWTSRHLPTRHMHIADLAGDEQSDLIFFDCEKTIVYERVNDRKPVEVVGTNNPFIDLVVHEGAIPQFVKMLLDYPGDEQDIVVQSFGPGPGGNRVGHVQFFRTWSSFGGALPTYEIDPFDSFSMKDIPDINDPNVRVFVTDWDSDMQNDVVVKDPMGDLLLYPGNYNGFSTYGEYLGANIGSSITSFQVVKWDTNHYWDILWLGATSPGQPVAELKLLLGSYSSGFSEGTFTYTGDPMGLVGSFQALHWAAGDSGPSLLVLVVENGANRLQLWRRKPEVFGSNSNSYDDDSLSLQSISEVAAWSLDRDTYQSSSAGNIQVRRAQLDTTTFALVSGTPATSQSSNDRMRVWRFGHCVPDTACSQAGICHQLTATCLCVDGRDESDCSGCAAGFYSSDTQIIGELPMCLSCPVAEDAVCTSQGVCMDDKLAKKNLQQEGATNARITNAVGTGECSCSDYYNGNDCSSGQCPAGKEPVTTDGVIACETCAGGTGKNFPGDQKCTDCVEGKYHTSAGICEPCPAGQYSKYKRSSQCDDCLENSVSYSDSSECTVCPAGSIRVSASECEPCPPGSAPYRDDFGNYTCEACQGGEAPQSGACAPCVAGKYSDSGDAECSDCPPGRYSDQERTWGVKQCQLCPVGTYNSGSGSNSLNSCTSCPTGSTTVNTSQTDITSCILPYGSQSFVCVAGEYCTITGMMGIGLQRQNQVAIFKDQGIDPYFTNETTYCSNSAKVAGVPNDGISSYTAPTGDEYKWGSQLTCVGGTYELCWCANLHDKLCEGAPSFQIWVGKLTIQGPFEVPNENLTFVRARSITTIGPVDGVDLLPTDVLLVSSSCWESVAVEGMATPSSDAISEFNGTLSVTYPEFYPPPGNFQLCWGRSSKSFAAAVGTVTVHGPQSGQSFACFNGQPCMVANLSGLELAYGDQLMPSPDCLNPVDDMPVGGIYTTTESYDPKPESWRFGYNSEVMNVRTGAYKLCWRRPPHELWVNIGFFEVKGPQGDLVVICEVGRPCEISLEADQPFRGLGLAVGDAIKMRQVSCMTHDSLGEMAGKRLPLWDKMTYASTGQKGTFNFNLGTLPEDAVPGSYKVCWCPASKSPACSTSTSGDFQATAGTVEVRCPLGSYAAGRDEDACARCPRGAYCAGGLPAVARKTLCDFGKTTLTTGSSNVTACKCQPGYEYNTQQEVCQPCARGHYKSTVSSTDPCELCAEGYTTFGEGSTNAAACAVPLKGDGAPPSQMNITNTAQVWAVTTTITLPDLQLQTLGGESWLLLEGNMQVTVARATGNTPGQIQIEFLNQLPEVAEGDELGARRIRRMSQPYPGKRPPARRLTSANSSNAGSGSPTLRIVINTRSQQEAQASSADMGTTSFLLDMAATTGSEIQVESNASVELGTVTCAAQRSVPPGVSIVSADECECSVGYGVPTSSVDCNPCPRGEYKSDVGNVACSKCASRKSTQREASTEEAQCICQAGTYLNSQGECSDCEQGYYCDGTLRPCRANSNTSIGMRAVYWTDCLCLPGYTLDENKECSPCESGKYKPPIGNGPCSLSCPQNAVTEPGASSNFDCFCIPGTYASTSSNNELIACLTCPQTGLTCRGGFEGPQNVQQSTGGNASDSGRRLSSAASKVHALPVAQPGYFQTGVTTAVPCKITDEAGVSQCRGGEECVAYRLGQEVPSSVSCYGEFGTACGEGSSGMLCGRCPPGWSRDAYPNSCEACGSDAWASTILSVLAELGTQAWVILTVASMAAKSSGAGGSLHSALIRIFSQWLAACSVITNFDLEKISGFSWAKRAAQMEVLDGCGGDGSPCEQTEAEALFQWPPQLTDFMNVLFAFTGIFPSVGSTQEMLECLVEDHDGNSEAKMFIPALFYLAYPLLLALMCLFVCAVFVYICVPIMKRLGVPLSIDLVKVTTTAVAAKSTIVILGHMGEQLAAWGLDVDEVAEALGEAFNPEAIQAVLEDPAGAIPTMFELCKPLGAKMFAFKAWPALEESMLERGMCLADLRQFAMTFSADDLIHNIDLIARNPLAMANIVYASGIRAEGGAEGAQPDVQENRRPALPALPMEQKNREIAENKRPSLTMEQKSRETAEPDELPPLIIGLFTERPSPCTFLLQCSPVMWLALHQMWPFLLRKFLMMIWCSPVLLETSGQLVVEQRLLPNPDVQCFTRDHWKLALCALVGLGVWCIGGPLIIYSRIRALGPEKYAPENAATFGYFLKGYEPTWWYWDVVVKRFDVGMMMVITYTSITDDDKARLLLYPFISGLTLALTSWAKPFDKRQANLLDFMESVGLTVRFVFFSMIAVLLIFNAGLVTTIAMGSFVCFSSAFFGLAMLLHVAAQCSQQEEQEEEEAEEEDEEKEEEEEEADDAGSTGSVKGMAMHKAKALFKSSFLAAFLSGVFKVVQKIWAQDKAEKVTVLLEKKATVARVGFKCEEDEGEGEAKKRGPIKRALMNLRARFFRNSEEHQRTAIVIAMGQFHSLWLTHFSEKNLTLDQRVVCILALASHGVSKTTRSSNVLPLWKEHALKLIEEALAENSKRYPFTADDVYAMTMRFQRLRKEEATDLIDTIQKAFEQAALKEKVGKGRSHMVTI